MMPPSGPDSSLAFMPNTEAINERGMNMIVTTVKMNVDLPCVKLSSALLRANFALVIVAWCCLRSSGVLN